MMKNPRNQNEKEEEIEGKRKNTRAEVDSWIEENSSAFGLDWRVGYQVKFRNYHYIYIWRWIKDNKKLEPVK